MMARNKTRGFALAALAAMAATGTAQGGGLEANGYNWDLLFDPATYVGRGTVTGVMINHDITNPGVFPGTVATSSDRFYYNFAYKADFLTGSSCLVSVQNPFGSGTDRTLPYALATRQAIRERITSNDIGLTCSYGFSVGPGELSIIGGISSQTLEYDAMVPTPAPPPLPFGTGTINLNDAGIGWRAGVAYEVPEIALRVSAIYNAPIDYELDGTLSPSFAPVTVPITADVTTPQSFEVKGQSGIAPGWLALASVKWVDWSVVDVLSIDGAGIPIATALNYEDGWTISGGIGHQLTEELTVLGSLTWDKGTSRENDAGVLLNGTQTDRWSLALGAAYKPAENIELSGGVSYSIIESGSNLQGETWDTGNILAVSASLKASF